MVEADVRRIRHTRRARAVDRGTWYTPEDAFLQTVAQRGQPGRFGCHFAGRQPGCDAEADDCRNVLRTGAPVALVLAARQDRLQPRAPLDPQSTRALGSIELVSGKRQQINAERPD